MQTLVANVLAQIESVVIGKPHQVKLSLACLFAKGHILIEDLPGMGKTTLANTLALTLGLSYQRIQFTSDLMPADVIGIAIFDEATKLFQLHPGAIFNQVVLADEVNRASPKTQSALLEAMEEGRVSVDGVTHLLPEPFFVIATQNPMSHAGTYPLPESQLDRFMMRISLGFPSIDAEREILQSITSHRDVIAIKPFLGVEQLREIQQHIATICVAPAIVDYVIALCRVSRQSELQAKALSPRAGKSLLAAAKSWAFMQNRDYVIPEDIQAVFSPVCEHRLAPQQHHMFEQADEISQQILLQVDPTNPLL
ncbi:AAA family ATPase [Colwellia sp. MB3u-70]|uniref:AAA family ATPase n=1 Tax=unclassified Colwellia TaxID=196834 RepID=UPI0015F63DF9|nr:MULTISPECIES: AAA family ATPase [unclassified Colwellia]MBA6293701.1 AAA family ATPase [Colwellia sp. MB3u-8]MBA6308872.1 AAA family ATPase [Colwellia sp. MB3u-70]